MHLCFLGQAQTASEISALQSCFPGNTQGGHQALMQLQPWGLHPAQEEQLLGLIFFQENPKCLVDTEEGSLRAWEACLSQAALEAALALPSGGAGREVNGKFLVRKGFFTKLLSNR